MFWWVYWAALARQSESSAPSRARPTSAYQAPDRPIARGRTGRRRDAPASAAARSEVRRMPRLVCVDGVRIDQIAS